MAKTPDISSLAQFHQRIDRQAGALADLHRERLNCRRGCCDCCVDDLTVFAVEALRIRRHHSTLLASGRPHPPGACAFLDADGGCRIYEDRPYVCRTQGLPLRWIGDDPDGNTVEYRDICPLNAEGTPVEQLAEETCWTLGPAEGELAGLQQEHDGQTSNRVSLRSLFSNPDGSGESETSDQ